MNETILVIILLVVSIFLYLFARVIEKNNKRRQDQLIKNFVVQTNDLIAAMNSFGVSAEVATAALTKMSESLVKCDAYVKCEHCGNYNVKDVKCRCCKETGGN